jgi:hypothetical protein
VGVAHNGALLGMSFWTQRPHGDGKLVTTLVVMSPPERTTSSNVTVDGNAGTVHLAT